MLGMTNSISTRLAVLGSGPAGYTAAIYAARAGLNPIVIQGIQPGGQLTTTTDVENYPGFRDVIQGPWLMEEMQAQAEHVGTKVEWDHITEVDLARQPFRLTGDQKTVIREIVTDMQRPQPMNRLLQGDVGSGKTIVALMAALVAM